VALSRCGLDQINFAALAGAISGEGLGPELVAIAGESIEVRASLSS